MKKLILSFAIAAALTSTASAQFFGSKPNVKELLTANVKIPLTNAHTASVTISNCVVTSF